MHPRALFSLLHKLVLIAAIVPILAISGCTAGHVDKELKDASLPTGDRIDPSLWVIAEKSEQEVLRTNRTVNWFLPFNLSHRMFQILKNPEKPEDPQEAYLTRLVWNDLGTVFLFLPLRVKYATYRYMEGEDLAVAVRSITWTPLYAWAETRGEMADSASYEAWGVPLFMGGLRIKDPRGISASLTTSLWSLGPAFANFKFEKDLEAASNLEVKGFVAMPLLLGGFLGAVLWSDSYVIAKEGTRVYTEQNVHGPLGGMIGWFYARKNVWVTTEKVDTPGERESKLTKADERRLVIGGILWYDGVSYTPDRGTSSTHGPLWGFLGWGKNQDRFKLKFLWIPITF